MKKEVQRGGRRRGNENQDTEEGSLIRSTPVTEEGYGLMRKNEKGKKRMREDKMKEGEGE